MSIISGLTLPYQHLNLRRNPFGHLTRAEKNELIVQRIDLQPYIARLSYPGYAIQFLKEGARNKTTHLLAIRRHFPGAPYIKMIEGQRPPPIPYYPVIFIDWFHAMPRRERTDLLKRPASFGVVSHKNHGREFRKAGLAYDLVRLPFYNLDQMVIQVNRCIEWARRDPALPVPTVSRNTIARLVDKYGDDATVTECLYDIFEELEGICHV